MFGRLLVAALAVVGVGLLLLAQVEEARVREPLRIGRPAYRPDRRFLEQQFYGINPASLILYTPPGFRQDTSIE